MKKFLSCIYLVLLAFCFIMSTTHVNAQLVNYRISMNLRSGGEKKPVMFNIANQFLKYEEAKSKYPEILKKIENGTIDNTENRDKYGIDANQRVAEFSNAQGTGVVIYSLETSTDEPFAFLFRLDNQLVKNKKIDLGDDQAIYYDCDKDGDTYVYNISFQGTEKLIIDDVLGNAKRDRNRRASIDLGDDKEGWKITVMLPWKYHEDDSRVIIIPYAVDCNTEDTVDYLVPAVYEGYNYHTLQDRRKDFDYEQKDPFGKTTILTTTWQRVDTIHRPPVVRKVAKMVNGKTVEDENGEIVMETIEENNDSLYISSGSKSDTIVSFKNFISELEHDSLNECIIIDTLIIWKKRDKNRSYRCRALIAMEDLHRKYYEYHDPGTCLHEKPFKFLEMKTAMKELELTDEFRDQAKISTIEDKRNLGIQFDIGTANIIVDSTYYADIDKLRNDIQDIESSGEVIEASLIAYASPDGREETNNRLTQQRAQAALGVIRNILPRKAISASHKIDSWENTAALLEQEGYTNEAAFIREQAEKTPSTEEAWKVISKNCPNYEQVVKPMLVKQCRISFSYKFIAKRVLEPKEAVENYYANKHYTGFSNGDYYNMFRLIKDSVELDTLTEIAYNAIIKRRMDYDKRIAPYIINRMALLNMKRGKPDTLTLAPMITEKFQPFRFDLETVDKRVSELRIKYNRPELVLNQAVMFYTLGNEDRALEYLDYLERHKSPEREKLLAFIRFKKYYRKMLNGDLTPNEQILFNNALSFVENSSPDNRAVIYTEFTMLNKRAQAWKWVHLMDDDNPRKWYLMALLWASRDGQESNYPLNVNVNTPQEDEFELLTEDEAMDLNVDNPQKWMEYKKWEAEFLAQNPDAKPKPKKKAEPDPDANVDVEGIPYYMAYFQKSFDMDDEKRTMMKSYFTEGHITEDMRKKKNHAFKNDRIPAYRKIYRLRKAADDIERAKYLKEVEAEKSGRPVQTGN